MTAFIPNVDLTVLKKFFGATEQPGVFLVSDIITPILEIQDIALFQSREIRQASAVKVNVGDSVQLTVAAGEFWLVHYVGINTDTLDADQAITLQLFVSPPGFTPFARLLVPVVTGNSQQGGIGAAFGRPLIVQAGTAFGAAINAITVGAAGSISMNIVANISRVKS